MYKEGKDYRYYPRKPINKQSKRRRDKTPIPDNRVLCYANGPKAEKFTIDGGKVEVIRLTATYIYIKTYYYVLRQCTELRCGQDAQHQYVYYDLDKERVRILAFTKLPFYKKAECLYYDSVNHHIH